jgi:hypothetical protein
MSAPESGAEVRDGIEQVEVGSETAPTRGAECPVPVVTIATRGLCGPRDRGADGGRVPRLADAYRDSPAPPTL